ncbi:MAG TPA: phosphoglucosamine mutase [Fimbriimonadaceae bacterium]|nr:phosphoglucosamine mutase [Fimbriimonadaceae bacterium]HRJ31955.1 phosphoglucosamine mutase [Fimbriimonadaceae bacterium]
MNHLKFGTDGVRGVANTELTPEFAFRLGLAAGEALGRGSRALMGRDTRKSGSMLGAAVAAGLCSAGVDVTTLGVAPTGAISALTRMEEYHLGVVISASHNPAPDNGIKLLAQDGRKVSAEFEKGVQERISGDVGDRPSGVMVGEIHARPELLERYMTMLETIVPERLEGLKVAVDGSQGAGFELGPEIFRRLGAEVIETATTPDGLNINQGCGATHPANIQKFAHEVQADVGVAFDGDADRAIFSDSQGELINGDRTLGIWAAHWKSHHQLQPAVVVGTVMSNGGFEEYLSQNGVQLERTPVGDKYVSARMTELGALVGGEQSGHLIFIERGPTGDGLITALELLRVLKREGRPLSSMMNDFKNWPQLLVNVGLRSRDGWDQGPLVQQALAEGAARLGSSGRLVVRPSGTQPMVRVMVEAKDEALRDEIAESIVSAMAQELGGTIYSRVDLTHALGD